MSDVVNTDVNTLYSVMVETPNGTTLLMICAPSVEDAREYAIGVTPGVIKSVGDCSNCNLDGHQSCSCLCSA